MRFRFVDVSSLQEACTEDLRSYLKSERGQYLVLMEDNGEDDESKSKKRLIAGEDLRPMHDAAMKICDDVIVSDIPLMYGPGEVGLAALMIADEDLWNEAVPASIDGEGDGHYKRAKIDIL